MSKINLTHFGGTQTVTGSKHLLNMNGKNLLIDCGLFQGTKDLEKRNTEELFFPVNEIDAIFITHAHLDHVGYLPYLIRKGYQKKIYATEQTLELMKISLADSAKLFKKKKDRSYFYDLNDVNRVIHQVHVVKYNQTIKLHDIDISFHKSSHILGSVYISFSFDSKTIVFSGDLGRQDSMIQKIPTSLKHCDALVIESTYGIKTHKVIDYKKFLDDKIKKVKQRGGSLLIPAFAIDRTQIVLKILIDTILENKIEMPLVLTGAMGIEVTKLYEKYSDDLNYTKSDFEKIFKKIRIIEHHNELEDFITKNMESNIIVAGSGMLSGGTVLAHFKKIAIDPNSMILFCGYQAEATLGRELIDGKKLITIEEEELSVVCEIENLTGLSAHCSVVDLEGWYKDCISSIKKIIIVHGEEKSRRDLELYLQTTTNAQIICAEENSTYEIF